MHNSPGSRVSARLRALLALLCACGVEPYEDYGDATTDPELPPRGMHAIDAWLETGYYLDWRCEPAPRPAMLVSPHGIARVCSNAVLAAAPGTTWLPIGAATVKEIYDEGMLVGHAVSRKVADTWLPGWYWYEFHSNRLHADGMNTGSCPGCHMDAPTELTFVIVR